VTSDGEAAAATDQLHTALQIRPEQTARLQLRATGTDAWTSDRIGKAPDHNSAEWSLWIGRPLLGQWVRDIRTAISVLEQNGAGKPVRLRVAGSGPAAIAVLCAAALDRRIDSVTAHAMPASWLTDRPYDQQRLGMLPPGILRDVGDIDQIAALIAPAPLQLLAPTNGQGQPLSGEALEQAFAVTRGIFSSSGEGKLLQIQTLRAAE
jgi:hypothetical protein